MIQTLFLFLSLVFDSSFNDLSRARNAFLQKKDRDAFHNGGEEVGGGRFACIPGPPRSYAVDKKVA